MNAKGQVLAGVYCLSSAGFNSGIRVYISRDMPLNTERKNAVSHLHDTEAMIRCTIL